MNKDYFTHSSAVSVDSEIGKELKIWYFSIFLEVVL